jgi:predicted phosphoribosyltransferase
LRVAFNSEFEELLYIFKDRFKAGRRLGERLKSLEVPGDVLFATPAGGVEALVVDNGIATGYTMTATTGFLKKLSAERVVAAAPTRHYVRL